MLLGLRTIIYPAPDLAVAKTWYSKLLGIEPYFDEDFYVGYNVAGYELALDPHADVVQGPLTYWGVADADTAYAQLLAAGATELGPVQEVGDGIRVATVRDIAGNVFGVIENPHFKLDAAGSDGADGPGK